MRGYVRLDGGGPCNAHAAAFGNDRCIARSADRQSQEIVHVRGREVSEFEISIVRLSPNATWRRRCDMDAALAPAVGSGRSRIVVAVGQELRRALRSEAAREPLYDDETRQSLTLQPGVEELVGQPETSSLRIARPITSRR
jgi:hypothetical protein